MHIRELLGLSDEIISKSKIHFAMGGKDRFEPLYSFYNNEFKEWQEIRGNNCFNKEYIFALIYNGRNEWLFAGIYRKINVEKIDESYKYNTGLLDISSDLIGRLVIRFKKPYRQSYPHLITSFDEFELLEILRERYTVAPSAKFDNTKIKFDLLKSVVNRNDKSLETTLSIVRGVYMISNLSNGKQFIGSAYNKELLGVAGSQFSSRVMEIMLN
jgi:hypothetical protein